MKKILKSTLAVLLAVVMAFGVYLPMSGVTLLDAFTVEASAASIPAVSSYLDYHLIKCKDEVSYIVFTSLNGSYNYQITLSNDDYGFSQTKTTYSSGAETIYIFFDLGALPTDDGSSFSWNLKITTYSGSTAGGWRSWSDLIDNCCYYAKVGIPATSGRAHCYGIEYRYNDGSDNYIEQKWPGTCSGTTKITSTKPTRTGYTFLGWSENKSATTATYYSNGNVSYDHSRLTLYAVWSPNKYIVKYYANGGTGSMSSSTHTYDQNKTLSANRFTRSGYSFLGWSTSSGATSATYSDGQSIKNLTSTDGATVNLYAVWDRIPTYAVSYNANGGSGAPSAQTKTKDVTLKLSSTKPLKSYKIIYNANGGTVSTDSKTLNCTFKNWNTAQDGSGTSYSPGASYTANSGATLYAQWTNPTYGALPIPTRTGYTFSGWYTSASGGTKVTSSSIVSSNTTLHAHWTQIKEDIYNLGEETYSFSNYGDYDSPGGHCFGMSVTSSAYYIKELDIASVGGNDEQDVYSLSFTSAVRVPICYYQDIQDSRRDRSMVAGGSSYKNGRSNISSDWTEVVNYVKNHNYDNKGTLQIGFRKDGEGGHAINFLYYAEVDGQPRIYAYDNNFPNVETYFYMDSNGNVKQAPRSTFSGSIDCITLRSVPKYFDLLEGFDTTRYIYADKDTISIEGTTVYALEGGIEMGERVMYEVPADVNQVTITPLVDNAEFEYLDESYSFGDVDDDTVGVFTLASSNDEGGVSSPGLTIENENKSIWDIISDFFMMIIDLLFGWMF